MDNEFYTAQVLAEMYADAKIAGMAEGRRLRALADVTTPKTPFHDLVNTGAVIATRDGVEVSYGSEEVGYAVIQHEADLHHPEDPPRYGWSDPAGRRYWLRLTAEENESGLSALFHAAYVSGVDASWRR